MPECRQRSAVAGGHAVGRVTKVRPRDYARVIAWMQFAVPKKERLQLFADLQVMESAVLAADAELMKNKKET